MSNTIWTKRNQLDARSLEQDKNLKFTFEDDIINEDGQISGIGIHSQNLMLYLILYLKWSNIEWHCLLKQNWSGCDDMYPYTQDLIELFADDWMSEIDHLIGEECREWWEGLPSLITIYRGCEIDRTDGLCWTTSREVAVRFAKGHRGMKLIKPVIAQCRVRKNEIFYATNDREEFEIVVDTSVAKITVEPFKESNMN